MVACFFIYLLVSCRLYTCFILVSESVGGYDFDGRLPRGGRRPKHVRRFNRCNPFKPQPVFVGTHGHDFGINTVETGHLALKVSVLVPFDLPSGIPVPDVHRHVVGKFRIGSDRKTTHLIVARMTGALEIPRYPVAVDLVHPVAERRTVEAIRSLPPRTADGRRVMFVQLRRVYDILIVVHVSGQDMRLIGFQEFKQSLRVDRLSAHLLVRIREGFGVLPAGTCDKSCSNQRNIFSVI